MRRELEDFFPILKKKSYDHVWQSPCIIANHIKDMYFSWVIWIHIKILKHLKKIVAYVLKTQHNYWFLKKKIYKIIVN